MKKLAIISTIIIRLALAVLIALFIKHLATVKHGSEITECDEIVRAGCQDAN